MSEGQNRNLRKGKNMRGYCKFAWLLVPLLTVSVVSADSPLTSTTFHEAYSDLPEVADHVGAPMDREIYEMLRSDEYPLDVKVAIINAMGWNFDGQSNAETFMEYYMADEGKAVVDTDYMSDEDLLMLAYMVSMDDYFNMSPIEPGAEGVLGMSGVELAEAAAERVPDDFTVRMISALILAQEAMDYDWGQVFSIVDFVMKEALVRNMREEAIDIIMNYIGLYYGY
jgi:hypothetical protein